MHNYIASARFTREEWKTNSPILEEYMDFGAYNIWVPGPAMTCIAGTYVSNNISEHPVVELPDAVTTKYTYAFRKPRTWINGTVSAKIWFTGSVVVTGTMVTNLGIIGTRKGIALNTVTLSANNLINTPTTGNALNVYEGYLDARDGGNVDINFSHNIINVVFSRNGAHADDDYTSIMYLLGLEIIYTESNHQKIALKVSATQRNHAFDRL